MAIVQEREGEFWHTYSDAGMYIHGGIPEADYGEAYDTEQLEYVETEIPIDQRTPDEKEDEEKEYYEEAGRILLGEEVE